jgi:hypothetical protein
VGVVGVVFVRTGMDMLVVLLIVRQMDGTHRQHSFRDAIDLFPELIFLLFDFVYFEDLIDSLDLRKISRELSWMFDMILAAVGIVLIRLW